MSDTSSDSDGYPVEISITDSNDKLWLGMTAKCSIILNEEKDTKQTTKHYLLSATKRSALSFRRISYFRGQQLFPT